MDCDIYFNMFALNFKDKNMKNLFIALFGLFSFCASAQTFTVTPTGLKDSLNVEKNYVVLNIENKTAKELYDNMIKYINLNYKNPAEVIKGSVDSDFIKFDTYVSEFPKVTSMGAKMNMGTTYTTILTFQDNKIKYEVVDLIMKNKNGGNPVIFSGSVMSGFAIYNKSGELKRNETKVDIEKYFNNNIKSIIDAANGQSKSKKDW